MKRSIFALIALLFTALGAQAQSGFTTVTATVLDPTGVPYASCSGNASFVPSPSATQVPTIGGSTFPTTAVIASCDSFGAFTLVLADNNQVVDGHTSPPASQWRFTISAQGGSPSFPCVMTITGATQNISSQMQVCAAPLPTPKANSFASVTTQQSATPNFTGNGNTGFIFLLNQNVTSSTFTTNAPAGTSPVYQFNICQDNVGGHAMVWPANVTLPANYVFNLGANNCSPVAFIYNPNTAQWTPWQGTGSVLGASLPFATVPFSSTPSFFTSANAAYGITLTGNVVSSSTTGSPANGTLLKFHICQGAGSPWTFAFPANFLNTTAIQTSGCTDETYSFDGTNWSQLTQPAGGGGGGGNCSSSGAQGTFQAAGTAGACQSTNVSETGSVLSVSEQVSNRGPNPAVDVTQFGARIANSFSIPTTTGTITGGTNSLAVNSATGFVKNDGLALVGGGATNCGTAPVVPTGFPALAASMTGTGYSVAGATGSTSYSYAVIAVSKGGCYTAASPVLTISNGNATLGANTLAITSCSNSAGLVTCTVGSTSNLATGTWVRIGSTTDDREFGGRQIITVTNGTQFTYASGISSTYGMSSTTATGGTLYYWTSNHLTLPALPAGTNMFQEIVYRCTTTCSLPANAANYVPVYASYPLNPGFNNIAADPTFGTWDDYGTTMTQTLATNAGLPWFIPTTPPSSNVNDMLITTVTNISGTTFTLAANATNSTSAAPVRFDTVPAVTAAQAAIALTNPGGGGTINFPVPPADPANATFCYVTSSYLILTNPFTQGANLCLGYTLELNGADWRGTDQSSNRMQAPGFSYQYEIPASCTGANPCIWRKKAAIRNISLSVSGAGAIGVFDTSGSPQITSDVNFSGAGSLDYMTILYYYYYDNSGTAPFGGHFFRTAWTTGPTQVIGSTDTPMFISKNGQEWNFDYFACSVRGFYFEANSANAGTAWFDSMRMGEECQGPITPLVTFNNSKPGNRGGYLYFEHFLEDSGSEPYFVNGSTAGLIGAPMIINGANPPQGSIPVLSGGPFNGGIQLLFAGPNAIVQAGTNHDLFSCPQANIATVPGYSGCIFPGVNQTTATYAGSHTLNPSEATVIETATGTITIPHALAGQMWDVYCQAGTCTLAIDSGTLFGNGSTGSFTIPTSSGVRVTANGTNAYAYGLGGGGGGGGSPGGSQNAIQYNGGSSTFGGVNSPVNNGNYIVNYNVTASASVPPTITLPGVPVNAQTGTTYTIGAANTFNDRATLITATNSSAQTYTMVNPTTTGFGFNMPYSIWNRGTGPVTENASGFTVNGGASLLIPPNWVAPHYSDGANWFATRYPSFEAWPNCTGAGNAIQFTTSTGVISCGSSSSGVTSLTGDGTLITNSASTGAVTLTLGTAGAHKVWMNNTGLTATPGYQTIGTGDLPTTIVYNNQANTYSGGGLQDFSAMTWKVPTGAGATASATSMLIYDSTNKNMHVYANNADAINCAFSSAPTTGDVLSATVVTSNVLCSDAGFLATNVVRKDAANTGAAAMTLDMSGATGATALKVPVIAGATAGADGVIDYDSTNKNTHVRTNGADSIVCAFSSAPTTGDLVSATVSSGNTLCSDSSVVAANVVTAASAAAAAKQPCVSSGASKTCTYIDFPDVKVVPAANCNNATAGPGWSIGSGGTATCRAGTNNLGGYIAITDTSSTFATFQVAIPEDWDTSTNPYIRFQLASTDATNAHTIIPEINVACYKGDGSTTDDVAANGFHSLSTVTLNGNANRFWSTSNVQMNSTDVTGCVAGALMQITVGRATDTATNAEFYSATITFPRLLTVQAN